MKRAIKSSINFYNIDAQAELATRAYELYVDDIDTLGYDTTDRDEVELDVSECLIQAADEMGSNSVIPERIHERLLKLVINKLRQDQILDF